jgi:hypothetical protein
MKKRILSILILFITFPLFSQEADNLFPMKDGKIFYGEVIPAKENADILFEKAKLFIQKQTYTENINITCKDNKVMSQQIIDDVELFFNKPLGEVSGRGFYMMEYGGDPAFTLNFDFKILVKDYKYKYELSNFFVVEYISAPIQKVKIKITHRMKDISEGSDIRAYKLENFSKKQTYLDKGHKNVVEIIDYFKSELKKAMDIQEDW